MQHEASRISTSAKMRTQGRRLQHSVLGASGPRGPHLSSCRLLAGSGMLGAGTIIPRDIPAPPTTEHRDRPVDTRVQELADEHLAVAGTLSATGERAGCSVDVSHSPASHARRTRPVVPHHPRCQSAIIGNFDFASQPIGSGLQAETRRSRS